jgi:hypothetical protein
VLGERERTLETLRGATAEMVDELARQPDLALLQSDSRFIALLRSRHTKPGSEQEKK